MIYLDSLSIDELNSLIEMDESYFSVPWGQDSWQSAYAQKNKYMVCLNKSGFILVNLPIDKNEVVHLLKILTIPNFQRKGLGFKLFTESVAFLKKENYNTIYLEVSAQNTAALKFYDKLGMKRVHLAAKYYSDGSDAYKMLLNF